MISAEEDTPSLKEVLSGQSTKQEVLEKRSKQHVVHDELQRDTPRTSFVAFMDAAAERDFNKAARYLDRRNLPKKVAKVPGEELARKLHVVLVRKVWVDVGSLSDDERGHLDDGLPSYRDLIATIKGPKNRTYNILYQRVPSGSGHFIWKFSNRTVSQIPEIYGLFGYNRIEEFLASHSFSIKLLGVHDWFWFMTLLTFLACFLVVTPVCMLLRYFVGSVKVRFTERLDAFINGPVRFLLTIYLLKYVIDTYFHPSVEARAIANANSLKILIITWFLVKAVGLARDYWTYRLKQKGSEKADEVLLRPIATLVKSMLIFAAILVWLNNIGYDISAVLAGLGIGGLAVALGAQKSMENLIGTIIIYSTAPIRVGDFCTLAGVKGTVEEIGLWATQVRTLDRAIVFIPNALLAAGSIENFSRRDKFHFLRTLYLEHKTPREKIERIMEQIRALLSEDDRIDDSVLRVTLDNIGEFGFEVTIQTLIRTTVLDESKKIIAELNLAINQIVQDTGVSYAKAIKPMAV